MKSLIHSYLIWGIVIGGCMGGVLSLLIVWINRKPSEQAAWFLLIGVGSGLGLILGLAMDTFSQIKQARENKKYRWWKRYSSKIVEQPVYPDRDLIYRGYTFAPDLFRATGFKPDYDKLLSLLEEVATGDLSLHPSPADAGMGHEFLGGIRRRVDADDKLLASILLNKIKGD